MNPPANSISIDCSEKFRLQILSDMHLEFHYRTPYIAKTGEILCLCGDIGYPSRSLYKKFIAWAAREYKWIFVIAGNHEFYDKVMHQVIEEISAICSDLPNVTFLNDQVIDVKYGPDLSKEIRVYGATFWADVSRGDETTIAKEMNDYKKIYIDDGGQPRLLTTADTIAMHVTARDNLERIIGESDVPLIVLTHHLPSFFCLHPTLRGSVVDEAYASNCDYLIRSPVVVWAYGHSHKQTRVKFGNTIAISNPLGYPNELETGYIRKLYVDAGISKA